MNQGVPAEQFHQFIVSRTTNKPINIPLSVQIDASSPPSFPSFDASSLFSSHHYPIFQSHLLHQLHHQSPSNYITKDEQLPKQEVYKKVSEEEEEETFDPWSTNEVLALLRVRSTDLENWFPADFTWEHISRKLAELGYKRSAEKCKEKYEEETTCQNINGIGFKPLNNKYLIGELDDQILYPGNADDQNNNHSISTMDHQQELCDQGQDDKVIMKEVVLEELEDPKEKEIGDPPAASQEDEQMVGVVKLAKGKKRKSNEKKFDIFKGFCEEVVSKMITRQEEFHNKLIEDMMKRSEETIAKEEAWKRQEMERANKEIDTRAHEQAIAGDRQATIIEFLNKFNLEKSYAFGINYDQDLISKHPNILSPQTPTSRLATPTSTLQNEDHNPKFSWKNTLKLSKKHRKSKILGSPNGMKREKPTYILDVTEDIGKRWPRDEVEALISLRCSLYSSNISNNQKEGIRTNSNKGGSLWEKISQGMLELGYLRSAKRCKEKWENVNKYFRKTKDVNKKRAVDSKTCPYFQQLSSLYNKEPLTAPSEEAFKKASSPANCSSSPEDAI